MVAHALIILVAALQTWFMILEMFLWTKPFGLRTFKLTAKQAQETAALAMNQGLYNGFLAAGLVVSFFTDEATGYTFQVFFLACVLVAGIFGAATASRKILFVQALPAALALGGVFLSL